MQRESREIKLRVGRSLAIWVASHLDRHSLLTAHRYAFSLPGTWWWRDREDRLRPTLSMTWVRCGQEPYQDPQYKHGGWRGMFMYEPYYCCLRNCKAREGLECTSNGKQLWSKAQWCLVCSTWNYWKIECLERLREMQTDTPEGNHFSAGHEQANNDFHFICMCAKHTWHYFRDWGQKFDDYRSLLKALC